METVILRDKTKTVLTKEVNIWDYVSIRQDIRKMKKLSTMKSNFQIFPTFLITNYRPDDTLCTVEL